MGAVLGTSQIYALETAAVRRSTVALRGPRPLRSFTEVRTPHRGQIKDASVAPNVIATLTGVVTGATRRMAPHVGLLQRTTMTILIPMVIGSSAYLCGGAVSLRRKCPSETHLRGSRPQAGKKRRYKKFPKLQVLTIERLLQQRGQRRPMLRRSIESPNA